MKTIFTLTILFTVISCHTHPNNKKVVLVDNNHHHKNYTIIKVKPKKNRACKKHRRHWHCL
jgi:hypothetical protein